VRWRKPRKARAATQATNAAPDPGDRDPRLPPIGTELTRTYQGTEHRVLILADGFEYAGAPLRQPVGHRPRDHRHGLERLSSSSGSPTAVKPTPGGK
jgi:hypothetical protein